MSYTPPINYAKSALGQMIAVSEYPVAQLSAEYGILPRLMLETTVSSGAVSIDTNDFKCDSGSSADGLASIQTRKLVKAAAGRGLSCRFSALFSTPQASSLLLAGLFSSESGFTVGYSGATFCFMRLHGGASESQKLAYSTGATGSETATITLDGVGYSVNLTAGTTTHNATETASQLQGTVPNMIVTANNSTVYVQSQISGPLSTFSFSSATAVAAWTQVRAGVAILIETHNQADWNNDTFSSLDPSKGNVYSIQQQYSGYGDVTLSIEDPETGELQLAHTIQYTNANTTPIVASPAYRLGYATRNVGNTTPVWVKGHTVAAFIEGEVTRSSDFESTSNEQLSVGTTNTNVVLIRNRDTFSSKFNRIEMFPYMLSLATQGSKGAFYDIIANPTFTTEPVFSFIDEVNSVVEVSTDKVTLTGGNVIMSFTVATEPVVIKVSDSDFAVSPSDTFCIAARVPSGASADMQASIVWSVG